jgi:hypothetical protein
VTYIAPPALSELTPETRGQLAAFAGAHGHFAALRAVVARFPAALRALDNQYSLIIGRGRLDRWVRDAVFAVCSAKRGNAYLADALAREAVRHGADADWVKSLRTGEAAVPEPGDGVRELIRFSRKAIPGSVSGSARARGLSGMESCRDDRYRQDPRAGTARGYRARTGAAD